MIYNEGIQEITLNEIRNDIRNLNAEVILKRRFQKKAIHYYNVACALDSESTSMMDGETKVAFAYEYTFGIGPYIYLMRTVEELKAIFEIMREELNLDDLHRVACYIHNAGHDFDFIRHDMLFYDVFSIDDHRPIRIMDEYGIEFRDSAILSASTLEEIGKNLQYHDVRKLKGDLDYRLIRTSETPLTDKEWGYCINDVKVLLAYVEEQIDEYGDVAHIPMTNTGRARDYFKEECLYIHDEQGNRINNSYGNPIRNNNYHQIMQDETITEEIYDWTKKAFRGGFTHANYRIVGTLLSDIGSYDLTSAYPSMIVSKLFPVGKPGRFEPVSKQHFLNALKCRCCLFYIEYDNIRVKEDAPDSYISWIPEKMNGDDVHPDDNGRISYAGRLGMWMTEIDFDIINATYDYDNFHYGKWMYVWYKGRMPKEFVKAELELYRRKTVLTGIESEKHNRLVAKTLLNSTYGMIIMDPLKNCISYDGESWTETESESNIEAYNLKWGRFTYYPQGIWITAYCRQRIWEAILEAGKNRYCYTDTDSIKVSEPESMREWFINYNESIRKEMKEASEYYGLPWEMFEPCTGTGEPSMLGHFQFEGVALKWKTLGSKRYMKEEVKVKKVNDECWSCLRKNLEITVAGLPKESVEWFEMQDNPFDAFNDECVVPAEYSHKLCHTHVPGWEGDVIDYTGHTCHVISKGGVHLEPIKFSMKMSDKFLDYLSGAKDVKLY